MCDYAESVAASPTNYIRVAIGPTGTLRPSYFPLNPGRHRVLAPLLEPAGAAVIDVNRGPPRFAPPRQPR